MAVGMIRPVKWLFTRERHARYGRPVVRVKGYI